MAALTDGERKILNLAWQCFKEPPQVDYKKLQEAGGYKTAASATAVYLAARKKIMQNPPPPLTDGERNVLGKALHCVKSMPQVDYKKLQQMGSYKTTASATAVYLAARKKLLAGAGGVDTAATGASGGKKRKGPKAGEDVTRDAGEDAGQQPKKRAKKGNAKGAVASDVTQEHLLGESTGPKPKKRAKKVTEDETTESQVAIKTSPDEDETKTPIKREAYDEPVDIALITSAAQYLQDQENEAA